jgi:hypothetical protein
MTLDRFGGPRRQGVPGHAAITLSAAFRLRRKRGKDGRMFQVFPETL